MANIAAAVARAIAIRRETGGPGCPERRPIARGDGWSVDDVVCASGPHDRPFEERHGHYSIAIVASGTFGYRTTAGRELMTPGSLMLGSAGQPFECGHEHGTGDRCIAFWYHPDQFEQIAADAGLKRRRAAFPVGRVPPLRDLSALIARACAGVTGRDDVGWEELATKLAALTVRVAHDLSAPPPPPSRAIARVAEIVHRIERRPDAAFDLSRLASAAGLSRYHFLRTFERVTGVTPHQYVMRARLREAARRLATERARVLDVALDCGFGDVSNFNHVFRKEFGVAPRAFRGSE